MSENDNGFIPTFTYVEDLAKQNQIKREMAEFCDMMMAEAVDVYHCTFSDIIEQRFLVIMNL